MTLYSINDRASNKYGGSNWWNKHNGSLFEEDFIHYKYTSHMDNVQLDTDVMNHLLLPISI